ncbi:MAG: hypothetical protein R6U98_01060 [Pirellulaceae bacterium]
MSIATDANTTECGTLATYFPAVHATIAGSCAVEWFDRETSQIPGQAGSRDKQVDMLVEVRLHSGRLQWILLHFEIQSTAKAGLDCGIAKFNSGLLGAFDQRLVAVVVPANPQAD